VSGPIHTGDAAQARGHLPGEDCWYEPPAMTNRHRLEPCQVCGVRMAVPGWSMCSMCPATLELLARP
jgi:hypothetical protein